LTTGNRRLAEIGLKYNDVLSYDNLNGLMSDAYAEFGGNAVRILEKCPEVCDTVVRHTGFLDAVPGVSFKTRLKHVLDRQNELRICGICGKPVAENVQFLCKEIPEVHRRCAVISRRLDLSYVDRASNRYFSQDPEKFERLLRTVSENPRTFVMKLKSSCSRNEYQDYSDLREQLDSSSPLLSGSGYDYATKCRWLFEGRTDFPACSVCSRKDGYFGKRLRLNAGYSKYCSVKYMKADPVYWRSVRDGCVRNNGVEYPLQNPEILASSRHRYEFGGVGFDSSSELVAYVHFGDNVDPGVVRGTGRFPYQFGGKEHFYVPDLYLPSKRQYVEVKGRQFVNDDGTMRQAWSKEGATGWDKASADARQEARRRCMAENGVRLVLDPSGEMAAMRNYVRAKYGKGFAKAYQVF
jgi:hypothetical protein